MPRRIGFAGIPSGPPDRPGPGTLRPPGASSARPPGARVRLPYTAGPAGPPAGSILALGRSGLYAQGQALHKGGLILDILNEIEPIEGDDRVGVRRGAGSDERAKKASGTNRN
jgi:hypothetical protein